MCFVMFGSSDISWGESAERSCQEEDDEAGERRDKKVLYNLSTLHVMNYFHFSMINISLVFVCLSLFLSKDTFGDAEGPGTRQHCI